jgi:mRNA-capping enzyme
MGQEQVYFIDRDNAVFQIEGVSFFSSHDDKHHLVDTLVDGEMVIDKADGMRHPRYLIYDLVSLEGNKVWKEPFSIRYLTIKVNSVWIFLFDLLNIIFNFRMK